jgi:hypothetical protein
MRRQCYRPSSTRYRETMIWKLTGLSNERASRRLVPSDTTLLGVVKHLGYVERYWFRDFKGDPYRFHGRSGAGDGIRHRAAGHP